MVPEEDSKKSFILLITLTIIYIIQDEAPIVAPLPSNQIGFESRPREFQYPTAESQHELAKF